MSSTLDDGLSFSGSVQPPAVPPDPIDDAWRGPAGPAGPTGATGATGAAGAPGGVTTWNTRTGVVTLTLGDVTTALGYTPYNATNPSGYQTAANVAATLAAPGAIGGTTPGAGAFTTLSATSTISGAGFTSWLASPPAIGGTTAAAGTFSTVAVAGTAASFRNLDFRSGASLRMRLSLNNTAEGGSNAGSDLDLYTYNDAGSPLLVPALRLTRSTGSVQLFAALTVTSLTASSTITPSQTAGIVGTTTNNNANAGAVGESVSNTVLVGSAVALTNGTPATITSISLTAGDWDVQATAWLSLGTGGATLLQAGINTVAATLPGTPAAGALSNSPASFNASQTAVVAVGPCRYSLASTTTIYLVASVNFPSGSVSGYGILMARRAR